MASDTALDHMGSHALATFLGHVAVESQREQGFRVTLICAIGQSNHREARPRLWKLTHPWWERLHCPLLGSVRRVTLECSDNVPLSHWFPSMCPLVFPRRTRTLEDTEHLPSPAQRNCRG